MWDLFLNELNLNSENNILNFVEDISVQVVSSTNVLFSAKNQSTAILFNSNLLDIEKTYFNYSKQRLSFICLSLDEWQKEKEKYMLLLKSKKNNFVYIDENVNISNNKSLESASDIFGDNLLEFK